MSDRTLRVAEAGLLTTVQDLGRPGLMRFGVTPGGAADRASLILGNLLVGNERGAAALEITLLGPRLTFAVPAVIAITGADLGPALNGAAVPLWQPVRVRSGDELTFTAALANSHGARAYLCIAGGIAVEPVMGSRATDLFGGFGGWQGRALRSGDTLPLGIPSAPPSALLRRRLARERPAFDPDRPLRVVLGPQRDRFTASGVDTFLSAAYTVSPKSDRMGVRLTGPHVEHTRGADMISEGIAHGAVQVPGDGQPIVLLGARQTIGGYPKIATVIDADLDALARYRPGNQIRFTAVEPAVAREESHAYWAALDERAIRSPARPGRGRGTGDSETMTTDDDQLQSFPSWDPLDVARLIEALAAADVTYLKIKHAAAGFRLEIRRGDPPDLVAPSTAATAPAGEARDAELSAPDDLITAPLLGVFYRRPAPDQPPLAEEGARIDAGQPIGLIEVMKTYHEVTSPRAGTLDAFLVGDEDSVQYGDPIARLALPG